MIIAGRRIWGTSPTGIGNSLNLVLNGNSFLSQNGHFNISMLGSESCYLLDENGNILYDENGSGILAESCSSSNVQIGGFDMFISGGNTASQAMNLYLHQNDSTNPVSSEAFPLYMYGRGTGINNNFNLYLHNPYSGVNNSIELSIDGLGENDDHIPITQAMNLYIERHPNGYFDMFISGGATSVTGSFDIFMNANTTGISGGFNIAMTGKDTASNNLKLYTHGW
jgi:hypothetical protein